MAYRAHNAPSVVHILPPRLGCVGARGAPTPVVHVSAPHLLATTADEEPGRNGMGWAALERETRCLFKWGMLAGRSTHVANSLETCLPISVFVVLLCPWSDLVDARHLPQYSS